MSNVLTAGIHHLGLATSKLEETARFFTELLGWEIVRRNEEYPAIFISDGTIMLTLWDVKAELAASFDRKKNVGLHHVALKVPTEEMLNQIFDRLNENGAVIEFPPELLRDGPAKHMMFYEPSGIRVEFIWAGN